MKDKKALVLAVVPVALVIVVSALLQVVFLSNAAVVKDWLLAFGPWFIAVYIVIQFVAIVVAPIGGAFIWLPMMAILGPMAGIILAYVVTTPAFFINFYLAKRYGRGSVVKLIGKEGLTKIDHIAKDAGTGTFVIFKVLQGGYFDYIAYAAGLTTMSWKTFALINIVGGIPSAFITYLVMARFDNFLIGVLAYYILTGCLIIVAIYLHHLLGHKKN